MVLICTSLTASDVGHLFTFTFAIFLEEKSVQVFSPILLFALFVSLSLRLENSLYILNMSSVRYEIRKRFLLVHGSVMSFS